MIKNILKKAYLLWLKIKNNKYWLAILAFVVYISFFDSNSLIVMFRIKRHIKTLEAEKSRLKELIRRDSTRLAQLRTDDETFEEFARETYFYHKPNEDVYIIKEKNN
jgi:cell division protein FtsB